MRSGDLSRREISTQVTARKVLFELQVEQHQHDETYHREIARLPLHQRLNHMALHFAKYVGKIAAVSDPATVAAVCTDTFIIALSTANVLNADLCELIEVDGGEFPGLREFGSAIALQIGKVHLTDRAWLVREMAVAAGQIAGACEKIDHLEEINFRADIRIATGRLAGIALGMIANRDADPAEAVRARLKAVKHRMKLHGRI